MRILGRPSGGTGRRAAGAAGEAPAVAMPEVRWLDTRAIALSDAELDVLGPPERARAAAFAFAADRHRYQVAHVALRRALSGAVGIPPGKLDFRRERCPSCGGRNGRPALAGHGSVHFSLAHSADAVAIVIAAVPVGIDIERMVRRCTCDLADTMHGDDAARIRPLPEPQRHAAIMRWWVAAEAVLKCTGAGIAHGLADFPVLGGPAAAGGLAQRTAGCWLLPPAAPPGYAAAIALRAAQPPAPVPDSAGRPGQATPPGRGETASPADRGGGRAQAGRVR